MCAKISETRTCRKLLYQMISSLFVYIDGQHTLKIWADDTGMAFDEVVVDLGGLRMSYVGPSETRVE